MADLTRLPNDLDSKKAICKAIIETPKGCRNKFDYDPDSNLFMLGGLLPEGMMFPFDFGFIPSTLGEDGDPLDVMVLMDAPAHVGCLIEIRLIGIIEANQTEDGETERNDRLIGVAVHSYDHENLKSIDEVSKTQHGHPPSRLSVDKGAMRPSDPADCAPAAIPVWQPWKQ